MAGKESDLCKECADTCELCVWVRYSTLCWLAFGFHLSRTNKIVLHIILFWLIHVWYIKGECERMQRCRIVRIDLWQSNWKLSARVCVDKCWKLVEVNKTWIWSAVICELKRQRKLMIWKMFLKLFVRTIIYHSASNSWTGDWWAWLVWSYKPLKARAEI